MLAVNADSFKIDHDAGKLLAGFWESLKIQIARFWKSFQNSIEPNSRNITWKNQNFLL